MKRIITITRCVQHFVDIAIDDAPTEAEARRRALEMAGTDHRFWDERCEDAPHVIHVRTEGVCKNCLGTGRWHDIVWDCEKRCPCKPEWRELA